jgi:hypothetical protein
MGGNTTLNRTYSPRVHVCHGLSAALAFARRQTTARSNITFDPNSRSFATKPKFPKALAELDIYAVTVPTDFTFHHDAHFPPDGLWAASPFPLSAVRLMDRSEWEPTYKLLYP